MPIGRPIPQVVNLYRKQLLGLRLGQQRLGQKSVKYIWENCDDIKPHYTSISSITSSMLRVLLPSDLGTSGKPTLRVTPSIIRPPSGSSIFKFTRALLRIPTIRAKIRTALAVEPDRPMSNPISSAATLTVSNTPNS